MFNLAVGPPVVGSLVAACLASLAFLRASRAWKRKSQLSDIVFMGCSAAWILHLLGGAALDHLTHHELSESGQSGYLLASGYAKLLGYQGVVTGVCLLLLVCSGITRSTIYWLVVLLSIASVIMSAMAWQRDGLEILQLGRVQALHPGGWNASNVVMVAASVAALTHRLYLHRSFPAWLTLTAGITGLCVLLDSMEFAGRSVPFGSLTGYAYALLVLLVWRSAGEPSAKNEHSETPFEHAASSGFEPITGFDTSSEAALTAVARERRRISQELHDGVGSHIVSMICSLDFNEPEHKRLIVMLEQCLLDLKMSVDSMDAEDDSLPDALGRLRYRIQHSLTRLGMTLEWDVDVSDTLENVRGNLAGHAQRVAQEALSNVMRHSQATHVKVTCRVLTLEKRLMLEVQDNGVGLVRRLGVKRMGKGITGARQRARDLGGHLHITSQPGLGTCLRLVIPLNQHNLTDVGEATNEFVLDHALHGQQAHHGRHPH